MNKIIDDKLGYIGDSIFCDGRLDKINFNDTFPLVDSIVFSWYTNGNIKSKYTYMNGKQTYENIYFFSNGKPQQYIFISDVSDNYFYEVEYDTLGNIIKTAGELFFLGYLDNINPETLEIIDTSERLHLQICKPTLPYCNAKLYVNFDTINVEVFSQNKYLPFLKEVWIDVEKKEKEWTLVDVWLEQVCGRDTMFYNKPLYYKVGNG